MIASPPTDATTLWLPTLKKEIPRPWFLPHPEIWKEQQRILASHYFLVNIAGNNGVGEALICDPKKGGCGGKHRYITLRCVEQPFSGITGGIYAYWRAIGDNGLANHLAPAERARFDAATNVLAGVPDLAVSHPELARSMTRGLAANDALVGAVALGVLEPVPVTLARRYADRINSRGCRPRFTLPGIAGQGGR